MTLETPFQGQALLDGVSVEMAALHERHYKRPPGTVKTQLIGGDLLACVLGGIYTDVEKTLIEVQRAPIVQETRSAFQEAMQHKFIGEVERLCGREVIAFISNQHVGPDIEVELFVLRGESEPGR